MRGALSPELHWTGCVKVPANLKGNGLTAASDGTIYNSVQMKNGATQADYYLGKIQGGLYQWKPSDKTWRLLPGTEFAGNNGVEISKDEKEIYEAVSGTQSVEIISLANTSKPVRRVELKWFNVDNIHWSGDQFLTASGRDGRRAGLQRHAPGDDPKQARPQLPSRLGRGPD